MALLTPGQAAEQLAIKEKTVTKWLREGKIRGVKLGEGKGGEWRIDQEDLNKFIESRKTGG